MKRLLFQGDSITDCWRTLEGVDPRILGYGYVHLLAGELNFHAPGQYQVINRGSGGDQIGHLLARWQRETINLAPDILTILIGVNDLIRDGSGAVTRYGELFDYLLAWTHRELPDCAIVLLEPFVLPYGAGCEPWNTAMPEMAATVQELARCHAALWIPLQAEFTRQAAKSAPKLWLWDGVHPTPAGSHLIAQCWLNALRAGQLL